MTGDLTLDVLGVPLRAHPQLAAVLPHVRRTNCEPVAAVGWSGANISVREVTRLAVERTRFLTVHAGVVATPTGVIAFPAASGAGKSTLTAACVAAGFDYVCDEVLALDRETGDVVGFPRPIAMSATSRRLLGLKADDAHEHFVDPVLLGRVGADRPGRVRHVVLPRRTGGSAALRPVDASAALGALLARSFNHFQAPANTWKTLLGVASEAECFEAVYEDANDLAAVLVVLAAAPSAVSTPRSTGPRR